MVIYRRAGEGNHGLGTGSAKGGRNRIESPAPTGNYLIFFREPNGDIWVGVTIKPAIVSIG
jgi:hypothetical protein